MKRVGNLWNKIVAPANIQLAYIKSKRGKANRRAVKKVEKNLSAHLERIRQLLITKTFHTAQYNHKTIYEPKERTIYILPYYPDRIVQHALMNVLGPILEKRFIKDSFACIKGRGQHNGSIRCSEFVRRNKYCLKCDIRKFYPSIDQQIVYNMLEHLIKDKDVLWLLKDIIFSFPGGKNAPIGNLTSQWLGNFYLNKLDRFIKEELQIKDYLRYCDDFCLFSNDKPFLRECRVRIARFLQKKLKLSFSKAELFKTIQGVDFLGYRHFGKYVLLRKSTTTRIKRRIRKLPLLKKILSKQQYRGIVMSAWGWLKHANTYNLKRTLNIDKYITEIQTEIRQERKANARNKKVLGLCRAGTVT